MTRSLCLLITLALGTPLLTGCGNSSSPPAVAASPTNPTTSAVPTPPPPVDKAAPMPNQKPSFSAEGESEHGDAVRVDGRWGPILPPGESDVDQEVLRNCPETNGRELVRRLDLSFTITSGLSADVKVTPPVVAANEAEGAEEIRNLNFVVATPEGTICTKGLGEEEPSPIDLGVLQPHQPRSLTIWVALINAITPSDPHPSRTQLKHQEWWMDYPGVFVDEAVVSLRGGGGSVTE